MGKLMSEMLAAMRQYFETAWWWGAKPAANVTSTLKAFNAINAVNATPLSGAPAATALETVTPADRDFRFRLARKNAHVAFANLGQSFQRMMLEPKAQQKFVAEFNDLLVQCHVLAAEITAAAPLVLDILQQESEAPQPLDRALAVVRENLARAQAGEPPPGDQTETTKNLTRELDSMVVDIEKSGARPTEFVQAIKLLVLQIKQMLAASFLIRKDAAEIQLPM
jgi:uncharacterized membrane protein YccC